MSKRLNFLYLPIYIYIKYYNIYYTFIPIPHNNYLSRLEWRLRWRVSKLKTEATSETTVGKSDERF